MKNKLGLLLKEAPEPTKAFYCGFVGGNGCNAVFFDEFEYKQHRKQKHKEVYTYDLEPAYYTEYSKTWTPAFLVKRWVELSEYQGRMIAPFDKLTRPAQRYKASIKQLENRRKNKTCHCGKKFKWPRRTYCSDECASEWNYVLTSYWSGHKSHFLNSEPYRIPAKNSWNYWDTQWFCEHCKTELKREKDAQVDHIIAIALGGHPWDYRNLQILCYPCHKIKTKIDLSILKYWWHADDNDINLIERNQNTILEAFCQ